MMDPLIKERWATALESGTYKQGTRNLHDIADRYCCLGVLCDLSGLGTWEKRGPADRLSFVPSDGSQVEDCYLPEVVVTWAGLLGPSPTIRSNELERPLSELNDTGRDFKTIAAYIKDQL